MSRRSIIVQLLVAMLTGTAPSQTFESGASTLLAFGDINLGRQVGQRLFEGDTLYPFRQIGDVLGQADVVFANLESPLTDQGGETRHPSDAYRFCGPRSGASSLSAAGIRVVSGANNHAYDYGRRGVLETLSSLDEAGVLIVGLRKASETGSDLVVRLSNGVRIGFVAYTEFVNVPGKWPEHIDLFDQARARREIGILRTKADIVVASYHGGSEYTTVPPAGTRRNLRTLADAGADIVLGHHPHVPQGIEMYRGSVIWYSLGNFVFYQPQEYWTQIGLAACIHIGNNGGGASIDGMHVIPFRAGLQPIADLTGEELDSLESRFNETSPSMLRREGSSFILRAYDHSIF